MEALLSRLQKWSEQPTKIKSKFKFYRQAIILVPTIFLVAFIFISPSHFFFKTNPSAIRTAFADRNNGYVLGKFPQLYEFFAQQPKDILIASLAHESDNLPSFAQRSVLIARENALPYKVGYYKEIRQRVIDLINAQYSPELVEIQHFIRKYGIDFWLLEKSFFFPEYISAPYGHYSNWIIKFQPAANKALTRLENGTLPALRKVMLQKQCTVFDVDNFQVLDTSCLLNLNSP